MGAAEEPPLFTGGDALEALPLGSVEDPQYDADDVIAYLYGSAWTPGVGPSPPRPRPAD